MRKVMLVVSLVGLLAVLAACQQAAAPAPQATAPPAAPAAPAVTVVTKTETKEVVVTATPAPKKGADTLIIGMSQEPDTLHPYVGSMAVSRQVQNAIWEPFITSRDYDYQANLVESLPTLDNGGAKLDNKGTPNDAKDDVLTVTFKLKPGTKWCDGEPVKASDFVFTYKTASDPKSGITSRTILNKLEKVEAPNAQTLVLTYKPGETYSLYYAYMGPGSGTGQPMPEHKLKGKTAEEMVKDAAVSRTPLGYGAYCVKEWVAGDRIALEANPNYHRAGLPKVKNAIFRIITDTNQLLAQLASGDVDVATSDGLQATQAALYENFEKQGLIKIYPLASATWEHMDMNLFARTNKDSAERKTPHPILGDQKVRQAIATCIDRKAILDNLYAGKSVVMNSWIPPAHKVFAVPDSELTVYKFDADAANKMLDEAGWAKGADGMRAKAGVAAKLNLRSTAGNVLRERSTQLIKAQLAKCGIDIQIEMIPSTVWFGADSGLVVGDYELGIFAWVGQADPGGNTLYSCQDIPTPENKWQGQNYMGWCNQAADKAILEAVSKLKVDERKAAYLAQQKEFTKDMVSLPLFQRLEISGSTPSMKNVRPNPTTYITENIWEWEK